MNTNTIRVRIKGQGRDVYTINEGDFDAAKHTKVKDDGHDVVEVVVPKTPAQEADELKGKIDALVGTNGITAANAAAAKLAVDQRAVRLAEALANNNHPIRDAGPLADLVDPDGELQRAADEAVKKNEAPDLKTQAQGLATARGDHPEKAPPAKATEKPVEKK